MPVLAALIAGIVFGTGLALAQMTNPKKVLDFLDIWSIVRGGWDPSLAMVFGGALPVMFAAYSLQARTAAPWLGGGWQIPRREDIDAPLITGSALFGIGWGLVGLCPGPAVAALPLVSRPLLGAAAVFLAAMLAGVWLANITGMSATRREAMPV